jgi:hypothetical protein
MKTVRVGFSRPINPSLYAKAIMWVGKTQYDHAYFRWTWSQINRDIIYQASKLAVNMETNITFVTHAIPVEEYEFQMDDASHAEFMQQCMDVCDMPYGVKEILGFAYVKILGLMKIKVNNPFPSNGSSWFCSQLVAYLLQKTGKIELSQNTADIDPLTLNQIVRNDPDFKRVL